VGCQCGTELGVVVNSEQQLSDVLSEFARTMITDFPIQRILDHLVERIVEIMPIIGAGVTLISPGTEPHYVAASNDQALVFERLQSDLGEGPCVEAYETGIAVAVPDLRLELRFPHFAPHALAAGMAAVFTFPLRHGDRPLGALDLYRDEVGDLTGGDLATAQTLADVAAAYLLNATARADLQDASDRSREAALHDALTGLPNRVLVLERLEHAFDRGRRSGKTSAVFFVDLDRFKTVNDSHGHHTGDELLVAVAKRLSRLLRPGDTLGRLHGDEFVILCEDLDDASEADIILTRIDEALSAPFALSGAQVVITASVGLAFAGRDSTGPDQLLHDADAAMYVAKRQRHGSGRVFDLRDENLADHQSGLDIDLRGVSARGELELDYQPVVDTLTGQMTGVEALLRWRHPARGLVAPSVVIPIAEQSGLIPEIGQWVLEHAWNEHQSWQRRHRLDEVALSVNVSAHQLMSAGFVSIVRSVLEAAHQTPGLLTLELTESIFVRDAGRALIVLKDLKQLGVRLALDDFGTGYSSLYYLSRFPVDIIKIDRAFIADLGLDASNDLIVAAMIRLAHDLGMTTVAEGVETPDQHRLLGELGCDHCQGFYFARPMAPARLHDLLDHRSAGFPAGGVTVGPALA
jgi:diguanylate cyclase (GGDEF)-like protein